MTVYLLLYQNYDDFEVVSVHKTHQGAKNQKAKVGTKSRSPSMRGTWPFKDLYIEPMELKE